MSINNTYFYNKHLRNIILVFGTLFNNIKIKREDGVEFTVPLIHGNKDRFMLRNQEDPEMARIEGITLPRMGFVINNLSYDSTRNLNVIGSIKGTESTSSRKSVFNPAPYNISITLYVWSRTLDDNFQIIEQILPFFKPSLSVTFKELEEPLIKKDLFINLDSVSINDQVEGIYDDIRILETVFSFNIEAHFYPDIKDQKVIKEIDINLTTDNIEGSQEVIIAKYQGVVEPITAKSTDVYQYLEDWIEFNY